MIKQDIKLKVPADKSKQFQDICFKVGVYWKVCKNLLLDSTGTKDMLIAITNEEINYVMSIELFDATSFEEVDADFFIRTNGTCEEVKYKNAKEYLIAEDIYEKFLTGVKAQYEQLNYKEDYLRDINNANLFTNANILRWSDSKECHKFWEYHSDRLRELSIQHKIDEIKEDIKTMFEEVLKVTPEQYAELHKMPIRNDAEVFAKYGFEVPEFECRLYDKINDEIFGACRHQNNGTWNLCRWNQAGRNNGNSYYNSYQLKPIKKPWYETCKYPAMIKSIKTGDMVLAGRYKDGHIFYNDGVQYILACTTNWILATNEEIEALKQ